MPMPYLESFDAEWRNHKLFREVLIADIEELGELLHRARPPQMAATTIDSFESTDADILLTAILPLVGADAQSHRYTRIIFVSKWRENAFAGLTQYLVTKHHLLLEERRVYYAFWRDDGDPIASLYRTIGSAQPVFPTTNGNWYSPVQPW
ncbi:MAG: hypothetical protein AABZ08_00520 [Planctomycetota bacterium]